MIHPIYPCLWFENDSAEAAEFYCSIFPDSFIVNSNPLATYFSLAGMDFLGINGGPVLAPNPSVSFFIITDDKSTATRVWTALSQGGSVLMDLGSYGWSNLYGWCADKYGVNWQIMYQNEKPEQMIVPSIMFIHDMAGKAEEAIHFYVSLFENSGVDFLSRYEEGQGDVPGFINHGRFRLMGRQFAAFDSSFDYPYRLNEGVSLVVTCDTQEEIDHLWTVLTDGGSESRCGWLKDRYGLSWQVVPSVLPELLSDPKKAIAVTDAFLQMNKFDISVLLKAAER